MGETPHCGGGTGGRFAEESFRNLQQDPLALLNSKPHILSKILESQAKMTGSKLNNGHRSQVRKNYD